MRTGMFWLVTCLLTCNGLGAQTRVADGMATLVTSTDRGNAQILLEGLPATTDLRVREVANGPWDRKTPTVNPVRDGSFISSPHFTYQATYTANENAAVAYFRARAVDDGPVSLRLIDQTGRVYCTSESSASGAAVCMARVLHSELPTVNGQRELVLRVQAEARGLGPTPLVVEGFFSGNDSPGLDTEMQVDPLVRANGQATVTWPINLRNVRPNFVSASLAEVRDGDGAPFRYVLITQRWDGSSLAANMALLVDSVEGPNEVYASTSHRGIVGHRRLAFLLPGNLDSVDIRASSINTTLGVQHPDGTPHDLELQLFHAPSNPAVADVTPLPVDRMPDLVLNANPGTAWPISNNERITLSGAALKPGRWYAVPVSRTGVPLNVTLSLTFPPAARALEPRPGHYYNPGRAGHGYYLAKAGTQWVLIWFTYDNDGKPVWYYAQGPRPSDYTGGSQWTQTLYRVVWNGARTRFQFVGWVQLVATAEDRLEFAHLVNGQLGIESVQRLGNGGCPLQLGGQPLDVSGLWYSPQNSGYGYSAEFLGNSEFYLVYAYDSAGMPRWLTGQQLQDTASAMPLEQLQGFCPTCSAQAPSRTRVGQLSRSLVMAADPDGRPGFGHLGIQATWGGGVPGAWQENLPAALLSARAGCQ